LRTAAALLTPAAGRRRGFVQGHVTLDWNVAGIAVLAIAFVMNPVTSWPEVRLAGGRG
jgi:hypothetical protein